MAITFETIMSLLQTLSFRLKRSTPLQKTPQQLTIEAPYREVFMCCPRGDNSYQHFSPHHFFDKQLKSLDNHIKGKAVFLSQNEAFQYCRFLDADHGVLRIIVPDKAILGQLGRLTLKSNLINRSLIHGYYVIFSKEIGYFLNPLFRAPSYNQ